MRQAPIVGTKNVRGLNIVGAPRPVVSRSCSLRSRAARATASFDVTLRADQFARPLTPWSGISVDRSQPAGGVIQRDPLSFGVVLELVGADPPDSEVPALRMGEVEAAHRCRR